MADFVNNLSKDIGTFLRYFASVFIGLMVASLCNNEIFEFQDSFSKYIEYWPVSIVLIIVCGLGIYSIHRAALHPFVFQFLIRPIEFKILQPLRLQTGNGRTSPDVAQPIIATDNISIIYDPFKKEFYRQFFEADFHHALILRDFRRWSHRCSPKGIRSSISKALKQWADTTHFLYCSAWSSLIIPFFLFKPSHYVLISGVSINPLYLISPSPFCAIYVFILLFSFACISDIRLNLREKYFLDISNDDLLRILRLGELNESAEESDTEDDFARPEHTRPA